MKPKSALRSCLFSCGTALLTFTTAHADSATWNGSAADGNLWSNVNNWIVPPLPGAPPASVPGTGQTATFNSDSPTGIIDLGAGVSVGVIRFEAAPSLTIGAGAINSQTLALTSGDGFNGSGASAAGTTLTINAALTVTGANPRFLAISQPIVNIAGSLTTSAASGTTMLRLNDSGISLNGVVSNGTSALMGLQLQQNGYNLNNANNSFTGGILLDNATANFATLSTTGNNSALGAGGTIGLGNGFGFGVLNYTGTGGSVGTTDRAIALNHGAQGGTLRQSGTGLLNFSGNVTGGGVAGSPTLRLQGDSVGTGEMSGSIQDNAITGSTTTGPTVASGSTTITLFSVAGIEVGAAVTGSARLQAGTTVTAIDTATRTITLSLPTVGGSINQNSTLTIDGVINPTGVAKSGTGTWTLSGVNNTYSGATTVSAGTLFVTGALTNSAVSVAAAGTIGSNGQAGTLGNGLTISAGGNLDLTGAMLAANSSGILSLDNSGLTLGNLTFADLIGWDSANAAPGTYELIDGAFTVDFGSTQFLSVETAHDFDNGQFGYFTDTGGSLNAVIFVPEPSTALLGGLGLLALLRRRRA